MIKTPTGRKFTPKLFRELTKCLSCGIVGEEQMCEKCKALDLKKCDVCGVFLRSGEYEFFAYDITEQYRDVSFIANKNLIVEFSYQKEYISPVSETECNDCNGWENYIKNECWICGTEFDNNPGYYKMNGNLCPTCLLKENV